MVVLRHALCRCCLILYQDGDRAMLELSHDNYDNELVSLSLPTIGLKFQIVTRKLFV